MCDCVNVEFGSYANAVGLPIPEHMAEYRDNRLKAGLRDGVTIDRCILEEIKHLWSLGIHTRGCCCGHNKQAPMVNVAECSIQVMKDLGYEVQHNPCRPGDEDTFTLKSVPVPEGVTA